MDSNCKSSPEAWEEFLKGISKTSSKGNRCKCSQEPSFPSTQTVYSSPYDSLPHGQEDKYQKELYSSKTFRVSRTKSNRPNLSRIKFKTHRPSGIKHIYDTDTELVLTLSIRHTRKVRPKLDKSCFEHPKRTVVYQPETGTLAEDDKPHVNETITSINVQRKGLGVVVPILIVACIFVGGAFTILFFLLFGNHRG